MRFPSLLLLFATSALAALPYKGVDWSSLLIEERAGKTYKNAAGVVQPLETILKASGVNTVRQRIWVRKNAFPSLSHPHTDPHTNPSQGQPQRRQLQLELQSRTRQTRQSRRSKNLPRLPLQRHVGRPSAPSPPIILVFPLKTRSHN